MNTEGARRSIISAANLFVVLIVLSGLGLLLARDIFQQAIQILLVGGAAFFLLGMLATMAYIIFSVRERILTRRAQRKVVEREAQVLVVHGDPGQTVFVRDISNNVAWRNLTLSAAPIINGKSPNAEEERRWYVYHEMYSRPSARSAITAGEPVALLGPNEERPIDLAQAIRQIPVAIVVGAMDAGKTTVLHWIIEEYNRRQAKVLVLDPHASPDKWPGATVVGAGRNFAEITHTLDGLVRLMNHRYDDIAQGKVREGQHPPIVVVADEWMAINKYCDNADELMAALLTESRKAALRVYVGSHSRRVKSLGVDGKGDLLDGVAFILLRNDGHRRWAEIETYDGETKHRTEAILPGEYRVLDADTADVVEEELSQALTVMPNDEELQILALHAAGKSKREITETVWGKHGKFYNNKVDDILEEWGDWDSSYEWHDVGAGSARIIG
jgi:hypothetical protein